MAVSARITRAWDDPGPGSSPEPGRGAEQTGRLVGGYRLVRKLGQGGMGSVYEAVQQNIARRVAIKLLSPELARDPEIIDRFFNEARAVNIVQHPDIINISELGQLPDGTAYLVMEYLSGDSLHERLRRVGKYPLSEALRVSRQIAAALQAAHDKGIVHRDLKPDNVMIVADPQIPGGERAKVLDFGIAKLAEEHEGNRPRQVRTRVGMLLGTPVYMSPEQCRGASQVDAKADVYSLGVMLYQMLSGRPPFCDEGEGELVAAHIYEEPVPLCEVEPGLPQEVSDLVQRMLDKDRTRRPTMGEVVVQLDLPGKQGPRPDHDAALEQAAGQAQHRSRGRLHRAVLLAMAVVVIAAMPAPIRPPARPPSPPPIRVAVPMARVRWSVITEPQGAEIVQAEDGRVLAVTPYVTERPAGIGILTVVLRLPGFVEKKLELDLSANVMVRESLSPEVPIYPGVEPVPANRRGPRRRVRPAPPARNAAEAPVSVPPYQIKDFEKVARPSGGRDAANP